MKSVSRRPGPRRWPGAAVQWAARHPNALLVAGAAILALALVFGSGVLPRPLHPAPGFEEDVARFDPPAKRAVSASVTALPESLVGGRRSPLLQSRAAAPWDRVRSRKVDGRCTTTQRRLAVTVRLNARRFLWTDVIVARGLCDDPESWFSRRPLVDEGPRGGAIRA